MDDARLDDVSETSPLEWRYTAEGGANLVLSYSPQRGAKAALLGQALRLRKRKRGLPCAGTAPDPIPDRVEARFGETVVRPLLGDDLCLHHRPVRLTPAWLCEVARVLHELGARPLERERADEIDPTAETGILVEDLIAGQGVLSIEIKPKWGFLPSPTHLSPRTAPLKSTYCRTCMHRAYKQRGGGTAGGTLANDTQGGYCPLDLYSRDPTRVAHALRQLWTAWSASAGEANNLRFFLNGKLVKPGQPEAPVLAATLAARSGTTSSDPREGFVSTLLPILLSSPVLPRLSELQRSLDPLDIEGLADRIRLETGLNLYGDGDGDDNDDDEERPSAASRGAGDGPGPAADELETRLGGQPTMQEWSEWIERWLHMTAPPPPFGEGQDAVVRAVDDDGDDSVREQETKPDTRTGTPPLRDLVLAYLLSATFKDCSVFIRIPWPSAPPPPPSPPPALRATPQPSPAAAAAAAGATAVVIKVIDLDPKPIARLPKYARTDRAIVEHFRREVVAVADRQGSEPPRPCVA